MILQKLLVLVFSYLSWSSQTISLVAKSWGEFWESFQEQWLPDIKATALGLPYVLGICKCRAQDHPDLQNQNLWGVHWPSSLRSLWVWWGPNFASTVSEEGKCETDREGKPRYWEAPVALRALAWLREWVGVISVRWAGVRKDSDKTLFACLGHRFLKLSKQDAKRQGVITDYSKCPTFVLLSDDGPFICK